MKGVIVREQNGKLELVNDLSTPEPGEGQVLVKSIYAAVNPVDSFMVLTGMLVHSWPLVAGCDAGGIVVKAGPKAISPLGTELQIGDKVCGCTRLGSPGFATFEEYYLMDTKVTVPVPDKLGLAEACTLGVASYTASLAVFEGLAVPIPDPKQLPPPNNEWALVLGGASSVGKIAVQILKACGYKVLVTVSPSSFELLKTVGADECISYRQPQEAIISSIVEKTGGKLYRVFDAVAQNIPFSVPLFAAIKGDEPKWFVSTNDWDPLPTSEPFKSWAVRIGQVGTEEAVDLNQKIESIIPLLYALIESGKITASEYVKIGAVGLESVPEAYDFQVAGKGGNKKVIVQIAEE